MICLHKRKVFHPLYICKWVLKVPFQIHIAIVVKWSFISHSPHSTEWLGQSVGYCIEQDTVNLIYSLRDIRVFHLPAHPNTQASSPYGCHTYYVLILSSGIVIGGIIVKISTNSFHLVTVARWNLYYGT